MSETGVRTLPLQGRRILVTRTREQAAILSEQLRALGAEPLEFPVIRIVPPQDWRALDQTLRRLVAREENGLPYYSWVVFTSANGVRTCCERLKKLGYDAQAMKGVRVAAIGPASASALARYGITADLVPPDYIAESVAEALIEDSQRRGESIMGKRILLLRAAEARKVLPEKLRQAGAEVDEVAAYFTLPAASDNEEGREVLQLLRSGRIDAITFTSSSTVRNFMQWLAACTSGRVKGSPLSCDVGDVAEAPNRVVPPELKNPRLKIACIGPVTSQTARELGLNVEIEAKEFTVKGLIEAIVAYYQGR